MKLLSATDAAILSATRDGTLKLTDCQGRFGSYVAISDPFGLIEVADDRPAAERRVAAVTGELPIATAYEERRNGE